MTVGQTLNLVHGLVTNMEVVMEGTHGSPMRFYPLYENTEMVGGTASTDGIQQTLGASG